ncbi:MAG: DUF418 domain-containing protein [Chloroflexi bacterium]|nr:DUF418 domain-containing protein [Chloroflexota bacterium]
MTQNSIEPIPSVAMTPVRPQRRIEIVDVLRGFSLLGVLMVNMLGFSGAFFNTPVHQIPPIHRAATLFIKFFAQAKFYTFFSFLFGWGMSIQMERAAQRNTRFVPVFLRRTFALMLIGSVHALLIWDGDILLTYALLALPLLLCRKLPEKVIIVAAVICILIPVIISMPLEPIQNMLQALTQATNGLRQEMTAGYQAGVHMSGSYRDVTIHRWHNLKYSYTQFVYWASHVFGMFLLGLYVGRRKILHNIPEHMPLFRKVLWIGLLVGMPLNILFVAASNSPTLVPAQYNNLAIRGARTISGSVLSMVYLSAIVLLTRKSEWRNRFSPLAAIGRMALSNYLTHSIVLTMVFYGYGMGLYGKIGPIITLILTFVIYRIQISLSNWWLERYRFGPAEWLWRSLTYGKIQRLVPEKGEKLRVSSTVVQSPASSKSHSPMPRWLALTTAVLRRLLFIAVVAVVIVYFGILGVRLSYNSVITSEGRSAWDLVEPTLADTVDFFADAFRGDLGGVGPGVAPTAWMPLTELLTFTFSKSVLLLAVAIGLATILGVAAGGLAAVRRHSLLSLPTLTMTVIGVSIPSFFLALLFQIGAIAFYRRTGIRVVFFGPRLGRAPSLLPPWAFPALVLAARPLAHITRVTFISISEILERDFIRTARAKGLDARSVFLIHALRNVGVSVLTAVIISLRFALGSLPVVEIFFNWPGLGVTMLNAIYQREVKVVAALALGLGVTFLSLNLILDMIYRFIDPRLRVQDNGGDA